MLLNKRCEDCKETVVFGIYTKWESIECSICGSKNTLFRALTLKDLEFYKQMDKTLDLLIEITHEIDK
jgi:hypothetical protein